MSTRTLRLLDSKLATGDAVLTTREVQERLGISPQAASNLLARLREAGTVDRVARGHYAIRQLGVLGTPAAAEDIALAVGAFFNEEPHRIAYRSALDHHGLLLHPSRTIQVACPRQVTARKLSGRRLRAVIEAGETVLAGAEAAGYGANVSNVERSVIDGAMRLDLIGGVHILAEALSAGRFDPDVLQRIASEIGAASALRRVGSLADHLSIRDLANRIEPLEPPRSEIRLDPALPAHDGGRFRDRRWRVVWPGHPSELVAELAQ